MLKRLSIVELMGRWLIREWQWYRRCDRKILRKTYRD